MSYKLFLKKNEGFLWMRKYYMKRVPWFRDDLTGTHTESIKKTFLIMIIYILFLCPSCNLKSSSAHDSDNSRTGMRPHRLRPAWGRRGIIAHAVLSSIMIMILWRSHLSSFLSGWPKNSTTGTWSTLSEWSIRIHCMANLNVEFEFRRGVNESPRDGCCHHEFP